MTHPPSLHARPQPLLRNHNRSAPAAGGPGPSQPLAAAAARDAPPTAAAPPAAAGQPASEPPRPRPRSLGCWRRRGPQRRRPGGSCRPQPAAAGWHHQLQILHRLLPRVGAAAGAAPGAGSWRWAWLATGRSSLPRRRYPHCALRALGLPWRCLNRAANASRARSAGALPQYSRFQQTALLD